MGSFECYYSTLEIEEKASQSEIKNAYRKLAIKHHPDKNKDNEKESKEKFIKIQKAFEILHDPQERSWYDQNKSTLIFNSLDSMAEPLKYRNLFIFDEYDDEERGFFTVYRNLFRKIMVEEKTFMKNSSDIFADFGYCHSPYDEIVRPFYNFWSYFSTQKTFKWKDCYDSKLAKNRSEFRAIEKENKVFRDEAKKTYNKELRSLVLFIKKRDPRIVNIKKLNQQSLSKKDIGQEFPPLNKIKPDFDWNKHYENYHQDMDAIESLIDDEFCEKIESFHIEQFDEKEFKNGVAITESDRIICLLCDLCFETIKSFRNHTKSRTHRELYQTFVQTLNANQDKIDSNSVEIYESNPKKIIEAQQYNTTTKISQPLNGFNSTQNDSNPLMCKACGTELSSRNKLFEHIRETQHAVFKKDAKKKIKNTRKKK